jgi:hypothetical protein
LVTVKELPNYSSHPYETHSLDIGTAVKVQSHKISE